MKALVLYHPESDHARPVEDFARSINLRVGIDVELKSLESKEGAEIAQVYDIVDYPAVLVLTNEGTMQKIWQGTQLPLLDEVVSYLVA